MENGPRRNEPANRKATGVLPRMPSPVALQDATERLSTNILTTSSEMLLWGLRCLCGKLAGGERCDIGKQRGRESWRSSEFDIRGDCPLSELRKLWGYLEAEEWLGWFHEPPKRQATSHSHEHTDTKGCPHLSAQKYAIVCCHLKTTPAPKWPPCPQLPFTLHPLDSDTNNPAEDRGFLKPYIT